MPSKSLRSSVIDGVVKAFKSDQQRAQQLRTAWPVLYYAVVRLVRWREGGSSAEQPGNRGSDGRTH
jgi:hypothetical protein